MLLVALVGGLRERIAIGLLKALETFFSVPNLASLKQELGFPLIMLIYISIQNQLLMPNSGIPIPFSVTLQVIALTFSLSEIRFLILFVIGSNSEISYYQGQEQKWMNITHDIPEMVLITDLEDIQFMNDQLYKSLTGRK